MSAISVVPHFSSSPDNINDCEKPLPGHTTASERNKLRSRNRNYLLAVVLCSAMACTIGGTPGALPATTPTAAQTRTPLGAALPTRFSTPSKLPPTPQEFPYPRWVADFAEPILESVSGRRPEFQDDFTQLNRGWFYFISGNRRGPFYAHLQEGTLWVKLPEAGEDRDFMVYNPRLIRKNFVLSMDFQFEPTQPPDSVRFQFDQSADQSVAVDLFKNKTWVMHWGPHNNWQSETGSYDYLAPERIRILIILQGDACAAYLNDVPLAYAGDCRSGDEVRSIPWAVTFHVRAAPGHLAIASFDNVRLWDLDRLP